MSRETLENEFWMNWKGGVDSPEKLWLGCFADADLAGDKKKSKSTAGGFLVLLGPHTFFPLAALCQKHGCACHSSPEAEVVSLDMVLRKLGVPSLGLWELILGNQNLQLVVYEDNQATGRIVQTGRFQEFRHVKKTHGIQLSWLTDMLRRGTYKLVDCHTDAMCADIFTKHFVCPRKWTHAKQLIGIADKAQFAKFQFKSAPSLGNQAALPKEVAKAKAQLLVEQQEVKAKAKAGKNRNAMRKRQRRAQKLQTDHSPCAVATLVPNRGDSECLGNQAKDLGSMEQAVDSSSVARKRQKGAATSKEGGVELHR